jgi:hypothetical protein
MFIKKNKLFGLFLIFIILITLNSCKSRNSYSIITKSLDIEYYPENFEYLNLPDNRIEIIRFHHTLECDDCFIIGNAFLSILKKDYTDLCEKGIITYRAVNSELLSNKPLCEKYESLEEDLVLNVVIDNQDNLSHLHDLWLLTDDLEKLNSKITEILNKDLQNIKK